MGGFSFPSVEVSRELRQEALAAREWFQSTNKWLGIIDKLIRYRLKPSPIPSLKKTAARCGPPLVKLAENSDPSTTVLVAV